MTTPERSFEADRAIVQAVFRAARPDQIRRLLRDILETNSDTGRPEAT